MIGVKLLAEACFLLGVGFYAVHLLRGNERAGQMGTAVSLAGAILAAVALVLRLAHQPALGFHHSLLLFAFWTVAIYLPLERLAGTRAAGFFVLIIASLSMSYAIRLPPSVGVGAANLWLVLHVLADTIAYGAWAVACGFGLLHLWEHFLAARTFFPSSEASDEISGLALAIGFVSLVVGLMLGAWWAYLRSGRYWDFRSAWSLVVGLVYAALLHARPLSGRSRWRLALISVLSFVVALLAFLPLAPGS